MMETTFKLEEKISFFTELSADKNAGKSIPGKVIEVKTNTGIIICEFPIKGAKIIEDFTLEGISIRGKEYGYITPRVKTSKTAVITPSSNIGEEIASLVEEALVAFRSDNREGFVAAQTKLATLGNVNPHGAVDLVGIITDFCKSGDDKPSPETMQAIRTCLHK
jgi:hypothetical protein